MLERRLAKIEAQLQPPKLMDIRLLSEPSVDATPEEWEKHRLELAEAAADLVILILPMKPYLQRERPCSDKIKCVATTEEAQMLALSLQPSERGNKSRLDDVIQGLAGNVLGTAENPLPENW